MKKKLPTVLTPKMECWRDTGGMLGKHHIISSFLSPITAAENLVDKSNWKG